MKKLKKIIALLTAAVICQVPVYATSGTGKIVSTDAISMNIGATVTISPEISKDVTYVYVSNNDKVVTVDGNGNLKAVSEGSAEITATAYYAGSVLVQKKTVVNVTKGTVSTPEPSTEIPITTAPSTPAPVTNTPTQDPTKTPTVTPESTDIPDSYTIFTFGEDSIQVSDGDYTGYEIKGTDLKIIGAGQYCITGSCSNGTVTVKKGTTDVELIINNLKLTSASSSALVFNKETEVSLEIKGSNFLSDTSYNNDETYPDNSLAENAVLKAKEGGTCKIIGDGELVIDSNGKNGIKANAELTINGPTIAITSVDNGISNESQVIINSGVLDIQSEGDGIKSSVDDAPTGTVTINGGTITIDSTGDGISATQLVDINGGTLDITTYGGADAVYNGDDDSYPSAKGIKAGGSYEVEDESGNVTEVDATDCTIDISGGKLTLNCADDGIHSDKDILITGGDFTIATGDDGIHAEYTNTIGTTGGADTDLNILIRQSCEAIEGAIVNLHSGTIEAYAEDDGVNAANADLGNYNFAINVTGGKHYISCYAGDGFDSNKNLTFSGGTTIVCGNAGLGEGNPLDCDGTLAATGNATVLGIGTGNMAATPSKGIYVVYGNSNMGGGGTRPGGTGGTSSNISITDGSTLSFLDNSGETIFEATAKWSKTSANCKATYVILISPKLTKQSSYSLKVNGTVAASATAAGTQSVSGLQSTESYIVKDASGATIQSVAMEVAYSYTIGDSFIASIADNRITGVSAGTTSLAVICMIGGKTVDTLTVEVTVKAGIQGDLDGDGQVTLDDTREALKAALTIIELDDEKEALADMDGNGDINLDDVQTLLKKALTII